MIQRIRVVVAAVVAAALVPACRPPGASDGPSVPAPPTTQSSAGLLTLAFELEQSYGDNQSDRTILGSERDLRLAATPEGTLYVLDGQQGVLRSYSSDGRILWQSGGPGSGPGEFYGTQDLALSPDMQRLFVLNRYGTALSLWRADGTFLCEESLETLAARPERIAGSLSDQLLLSGPLHGRSGARVSIWPPSAGDGFDIELGPSSAAIALLPSTAEVSLIGGEVLTGSSTGYEILAYSLTGVLQWSVAPPGTDFPKRPGYYMSGGRGVRHDFGVVRAPMAINETLLFVHASWDVTVTDSDEAANARKLQYTLQSDDWVASFDVFSRTGELVASKVFSDDLDFMSLGRAIAAYPSLLGHPLQTVAGSDGSWRLYTVLAEPFPHFRRYRVDMRGER